jgi:WD40 repeat protein
MNEPGVPFKYDKVMMRSLYLSPTSTDHYRPKTIKTHTKFVTDLKFALTGDAFASVGSDAKIFIYDGKTGETLAQIVDSPHTCVHYLVSTIKVDVNARDFILNVECRELEPGQQICIDLSC